jgi:dynein heavy chain
LQQKGSFKKIELAIGSGQILMIENVLQEIDPILDPLLSRAFVKKGKGFTVKLGAEDIDIDPKFRLYM